MRVGVLRRKNGMTPRSSILKDNEGLPGRRSVIPAYHRLSLILIDGIRSGRFPPGSLLPSEHLLTEQYGVSRVTVRRALALLVEQDLITKRHGHGTIVKGDALRPARTRRASGLMSVLVGETDRFRTRTISREEITPPKLVSEKLDLAADQSCSRITRVRYAGEDPISLGTIHLPLDVAEALRDRWDEDRPVIEMLEEAGIGPDRTEFGLGARIAEGDVADLLGLPIGSPVLVMQSVAHDRGDRAVYYTESAYDPDSFEYTGKMRRGLDGNGAPCWVPEP
jgi:GntR family transcriptional regulator